MKFEFDFSTLPDYVLIMTKGEPSMEEIESLFQTLVESPQWKPGTKQLYDHRKSFLKNFPAECMHGMVNIAKKCSEKLGKGACALVVKGDLGYGFARMYQMMGGERVHGPIGIFYSIEEAIEWLKNQ